MPLRRWPDGYPFGADVLVQAVSERIVANEDGTFQQLLRSRGYRAKQKGKVYPGPDWPGAPIDAIWEPAPRSYPVEPDPRRDRYVRIRRMLHERPPHGVLIGYTDRQEGIYAVSASGGTELLPPGRTIPLFEIALTVRSGPSRVVLAHVRDVQHGPRPRRTA